MSTISATIEGLGIVFLILSAILGVSILGLLTAMLVSWIVMRIAKHCKMWEKFYVFLHEDRLKRSVPPAEIDAEIDAAREET